MPLREAGQPRKKGLKHQRDVLGRRWRELKPEPCCYCGSVLHTPARCSTTTEPVHEPVERRVARVRVLPPGFSYLNATKRRPSVVEVGQRWLSPAGTAFVVAKLTGTHAVLMMHLPGRPLEIVGAEARYLMRREADYVQKSRVLRTTLGRWRYLGVAL